MKNMFVLMVVCLLMTNMILLAREEVSHTIIPSKANVDSLISLATSYSEYSYEECLEFGELALQLAAGLDYSDGEADAIFSIGLTYDYMQDYYLAVTYYEQALELYEELEDIDGIFITTNNLGLIYKEWGQYTIALDYFRIALENAEITKDPYDLATLYNNIGLLHNMTDDLDQSAEYFQKALELSAQFEDIPMTISLYLNIGSVYFDRGNHEEALHHFQRAYELSEQHDDQESLSKAIHNIGMIYHHNEEYDNALDYYLHSLDIAQELNLHIDIAISYSNIGLLHYDRNNFSKAIDFFHKSNEVAEEHKFVFVMSDNHLYLSEIYEKQQQLQNALAHYQKYKDLNSALLEEKHQKRLNALQHHLDLREQEIQQYQKEAEAQVSHQITIRNIIVIIMLVLMNIIFMVYIRYRQNVKMQSDTETRSEEFKKANQKLKDTNLKLQNTNKALQEAKKKIETLAKTDPLTNLANRREMMDKIFYEKKRFDRTKRPFSLIIADIDHFKRINDKYGHEVGDFILVSLSEIFISIVRHIDVVSRWGGEEFLILLPETDIEGGKVVAEKLRDLISITPFYHEDKTISLTITLGVSEFIENDSIDACIRRADEALYRGKEAGRNRVELGKT